MEHLPLVAADTALLDASQLVLDALDHLLASNGSKDLSATLYQLCLDMGLQLPELEDMAYVSYIGYPPSAAYYAHERTQRAAEVLAETAEDLAGSKKDPMLRAKIEGLSDRLYRVSGQAWRLSSLPS